MKITRPPVQPQQSVSELAPGTVFEHCSSPQRQVLMRLRVTHHDLGIPCVNLETGERLDLARQAPIEVLNAELVIH